MRKVSAKASCDMPSLRRIARTSVTGTVRVCMPESCPRAWARASVRLSTRSSANLVMVLVSPPGLPDAVGQRLHPPPVVRCPVFPLVLRVDQQQIERHRVVMVELDHPHPAPLADARPG